MWDVWASRHVTEALGLMIVRITIIAKWTRWTKRVTSEWLCLFPSWQGEWFLLGTIQSEYNTQVRKKNLLNEIYLHAWVMTPNGNELPEELKNGSVCLHKDGKVQRKISEQLKIRRNTVSAVIRRSRVPQIRVLLKWGHGQCASCTV